jgi:hypothetical protein
MKIKKPLTTKKHFTAIAEEKELLSIERVSAPDNAYECTKKTTKANRKRSKSKLFDLNLESKADETLTRSSLTAVAKILT